MRWKYYNVHYRYAIYNKNKTELETISIAELLQ